MSIEQGSFARLLAVVSTLAPIFARFAISLVPALRHVCSYESACRGDTTQVQWQQFHAQAASQSVEDRREFDVVPIDFSRPSPGATM